MQLTYYEYGEARAREAWEPQPGDVHTLRHGYNLADLDRLTRAALRRGWGILLDYRTRYELAWSAIAERLYSAPEGSPPSPADLVGAGQDAISSHVDSEQRHRGYDRETGGGMPRWAAYWNGQRPVREPEAGLIERMALWQVWPELTPAQRGAFLAVAACGTYDAAADSLGISRKTLAHHLDAGRKRFAALWHEHETPPGFWGSGQRVYRAGGPQVATLTRKTMTGIRRRKPRQPKAAREPSHGTLREYNFWRCRCRECTAVKAAESTGRRRKAGASVRRFITAPELAVAVARNEAGETWTAIAASTGFSVGYLGALRSGRTSPLPARDAA